MTNNLLAAGLEHHQARRFAQARDCYWQALAAEPRNPDLLNLLGAVSINLEDRAAAERYLNEAIALDPNHAAAYDNRGVLRVQLGRVAAAIEDFEQATRLAPDNINSQRNLAKALSKAGRAATEPLAAIARLKPNDPQARFELAAALAACGRTAEAISEYQQVLRLNPNSAETYVNLSQLHSGSGNFAEAARCARKALELKPAFAEAYLNLGSALAKRGESSAAIAALHEAQRLKPELPEIYNNLGIALADEQRFEEAIGQYGRAIAIRAGNADALYNRGIAQLKSGDPGAAIQDFDQAIAVKPDYAEAHHNRAAALLLSERWVEGFAEYEWRFRSRDFPPLALRWPVWQGEPLEGCLLVLVAEQGLGDTLQFVRFASAFAAQGARVILECPTALHPILSRTADISRLVAPKDAPPDADFCLPLLSAPHRLGLTLDTVRPQPPYIFAAPERAQSWRERLAGDGSPKIGIVWQGNARCPGDAQRSIALRHFAALAKLPGVRLISLQKGPGSEQLAGFLPAGAIVEFGDELDREGGAFMDTAAIMKNVDLVITSDTAAAHLAGALGVDVWVALQRVPDWRWLLDRADSPWYPTMRLFRQQRHSDWQGVFETIASELARRVRASG